MQKLYAKNEEITLKISDMGTDGEGIGKIDGFPFFVKGAVTGDTILAGVTKVKKNYAYARIINVISASPDRADPKCPVFGRCGGCSLMHLSYEAQIGYKENKVFETLVRIGGFDRDELSDKKDSPIIMDTPYRYRNKASYPVAENREGRVCAGFYAARTHAVIECEDCLIGPEENAGIIKLVLAWMEEYGIKPYDEVSGKGLIRHIFIRKAFATGQFQLCLVASKRKLPHIHELTESCKKIPEMLSICINVNPDNTNVIFGKETEVLYGREYIEDHLMGLVFRISPLSFYQVNPVQCEKLYTRALDYANLKGGEYVWDICCGIGTITLAAADRLRKLGKAGRALGLEIVPEAIENAKENAVLNGIDNVEFICAAAEDYLPERVKAGNEHPDVVIVDPPRAGLEKPVIDAIISVSPQRLVYVSCDPATLARDLKLLSEGGYRLDRFSICDMFSQTAHCETVVKLSRG